MQFLKFYRGLKQNFRSCFSEWENDSPLKNIDLNHTRDTRFVSSETQLKIEDKILQINSKSL